MAKTHPKEQILNKFVSDLNSLEASHNSIMDVAVLSVYSEYIVNQLIKKNFGHDLDDDRNLGQSTKLKILHGAKILADSEYEVLNLLRDARNGLMHDIDMDVKKFDEKIAKAKINYGDEESKKLIDSLPAPIKFKYSCIIKISYLLHKFYDAEDLRLAHDGSKYFYEKNEA